MIYVTLPVVVKDQGERPVAISTDLQATTTSEPGGRRIVWVEGELDLATAGRLAVVLEKAIQSAGATEIIIDLANLRFLDASGIRVLVASHHLAQRLGRALRARNSRGEVDTVLRLVRVAGLVDLPELPASP